jgi:hypothetical protein
LDYGHFVGMALAVNTLNTFHDKFREKFTAFYSKVCEKLQLQKANQIVKILGQGYSLKGFSVDSQAEEHSKFQENLTGFVKRSSPFFALICIIIFCLALFSKIDEYFDKHKHWLLILILPSFIYFSCSAYILLMNMARIWWNRLVYWFKTKIIGLGAKLLGIGAKLLPPLVVDPNAIQNAIDQIKETPLPKPPAVRPNEPNEEDD